MTAKTFTWSLIAVCILLSILLVLQLTDDSDLAITNHRNNKTNTMKLSPPLRVKPRLSNLADYSAMLSQPLFKPNRQQASIEEVMVQDPIFEPVITAKITPLPELVGVMRVNDIDMAFVMGENDMEPSGLRIGDDYKGWQLKTIEATNIVLSHDGDEETVSLQWEQKEMLDRSGSDIPPLSAHEEKIPAASKPVKTDRRPGRLKDRLARQVYQ